MKTTNLHLVKPSECKSNTKSLASDKLAEIADRMRHTSCEQDYISACEDYDKLLNGEGGRDEREILRGE